MRHWTFVPLGDRAATIDLPDVAGTAARELIRALDQHIRDVPPRGVTARVPAIRSLTLHYDPMRTEYRALEEYVALAMASLAPASASSRAPIDIPVCYGGAYGPDLESVAVAHDTSIDAIVEAHTAGEYVVAMIGFLPGFPYLEGLTAALHTPRRDVPRTNVPAGSVGIGGSSTGVYPCASPGGWHLIGRTPRALFAPHRSPPALLQPGDHVRFVAITPDKWRAYADSA